MEIMNTETVVFGLRYLEEEEAEIYDVVGCIAPIDGEPWNPGGYTATGCDDED